MKTPQREWEKRKKEKGDKKMTETHKGRRRRTWSNNTAEQGETFLNSVFKAGCESLHLASVFVLSQGQSSWLVGFEKPAHPETLLALTLTTKL